MGWMGVCVVGPARFFGCVGGQNGFLVFLDFLYVSFLWTGQDGHDFLVLERSSFSPP